MAMSPGKAFTRVQQLLVLVVFLGTAATAQTQRLIVLGIDGLPYDTVDRFVRERDPRTGKSQLPWIEYIFYERGTRLANFYVRGMSLSAPSWSQLETGQHLQVKGNVEFDRYTLESHDYLNLFSFLLNAARGVMVDSPGTAVLDSIGTPILVDAYPFEERYGSFALYQRGVRFVTFSNGLLNHLKQTPKDLFDEWTTGMEIRSSYSNQIIKELIDHLNDPKIRYLDLALQDFDHMAHHNRDRESQLGALKHLDADIGRIWTEVQKSSLADQTALIMVSDHGINSDENIYSQGYNLVKLLNSAGGGGHHVITKRRLLLDYSIKGVNPFPGAITNSTRDSYYLEGQSETYPTALLDFDGNERAAIHLRDSDLNVLHILLEELQRQELSPSLRQAATRAFFATLDRRRPGWQQSLQQLNEELPALHRAIEKQRELWKAQPRKFSAQDQALGKNDEAQRIYSQLGRWLEQERTYTNYARVLTALVALRPESFDPGAIKIEDVIPPHAMGDSNSLHQLQNYVVGISANGLVLRDDGSLDSDRSFKQLDYLSLLHALAVRNNVQPGVGNRPVDFIATRITSDSVRQAVGETAPLAADAIWVYGGPDQQAMILAREGSRGEMSFRYVPLKDCRQDADGRISLQVIPWQAGLPLKLFEDKNLNLPGIDRAAWLSQWHTEVEWLHAIHRTAYSNGIIGLYEDLARHTPPAFATANEPVSEDQKLMRRFVLRRRLAVEADLLLVANSHWNFDVRGFNPGGNHGSFLRVSTHATWMIAGGEGTGIPRGLVVEEPYDGLSFVPTLLALTGRLRDDMSPVPVLWEKGFRPFPGRVVREVITSKQQAPIGSQ
jgi:hypothetical protein